MSKKRRALAELSKYPHTLRYLKDLDARSSRTGGAAPGVVCGPKRANLITSEIDNQPGYHTLMLDIDVPAKLIPSSTPGHSHLYIDVRLSTYRLTALLRELARARVIERGYAEASINMQRTALRPPWVKKKPQPPAPPVPEWATAETCF